MDKIFLIILFVNNGFNLINLYNSKLIFLNNVDRKIKIKITIILL